jgi:Putative peptidoglycan binding domain
VVLLRFAGRAGVALGAVALWLLLAPGARAADLPPAGTGWHGRAIQQPHAQRPDTRPVAQAPGRTLRPGLGRHTPGGSLRVKDLQRRLTRLGYRPGRVDGVFGPRTQGALRWFQIKHGYRASGAATAATLRHLRERTTPHAGPRETAPTSMALTPSRWAGMPAAEPLAAAPVGGPEASMARLDRGVVSALLVALALLGMAIAALSYRGTRRRLAHAPPATPRPRPDSTAGGRARVSAGSAP